MTDLEISKALAAPTQSEVPLTDAQICVLVDSYYDSDATPIELIRKVEKLHGIAAPQPKTGE